MYYNFKEFKKHFTIMEKYHDGKCGLWIVRKLWFKISDLPAFDAGKSCIPFRVVEL